MTEAEKTQLDQLDKQADKLKNEYDGMTQYAFDYQRQKISNDSNLTQVAKQLELARVDSAEQEFFDGLGKSMITSKTLESLITTSGALEFHGSFNHAIGPSLKDLSDDILNNPAKLKVAVDNANQNAKYLADYIAYMGTRGDLVSQIGLNTQNINLIQQAGTKWDPTTGDWLSDKIFIAKIKVVENVPANTIRSGCLCY